MVRVRVVTIFLNEARFLGEAIASVKAQTFADWELILVDDGSTDASPQIAADAAKSDPRIRVVTHPGGENRGMSASRNLGVAAARGEFVAFLDGDDIWTTEKLAEQVALLDAHPDCSIVYGHARIWHSWDPAAMIPDHQQDLGVEPNQAYGPPILYRLLLGNRAQAPMTSNVMIRRELFPRVGGFEDAFRTMFEDQVFFVKAHLAARSYVSDACWLYYRQHAQSCTGSLSMMRELSALTRFLRWTQAYLRREHPGRWDLWPALLKARLDCWRRQSRALAGRALGRG